MIGLALSNTLGARAMALPVMQLSGLAIDENAASGTTVGTLSIASPDPGEWHFTLADDAGGRFVLDGAALKVGPTPLDRDAAPEPRVRLAAANGGKTLEQSFAIAVRRPLPVLPLPVGARVAVHGDSQMGFNNGQVNAMSSPAKAAADNYGFGTMTHALSVDPRFNFDSWFDADDPYGRFIQGANQGIFGDHMAWEKPEWGNGIIPRLDYTLSRKPQLIVFSGGTNSLGSGDHTGRADPAHSSYVIGKLDEGLRKIRNEGVPVILATLMPRGGGQDDWSTDDPRIAQLGEVNDWIRKQYESGREGIVGLFDPWDVLAENGLPVADYMDGARVHPNALGAYLAGVVSEKSLLAALRAVISPGSVFNQDPAVANLLGASMGNMTGTTGSRVGAGTTGQVATGFSLRMTRGSSLQSASKETVGGQPAKQVITINPVSDALAYHWSDFSLASTTLATPPAAGQWCRAYLQVDIGDTTAIGALFMTVTLQDAGAPVLTAVANQVNSSAYTKPSAGNRSFWLQTEPFLVPAAFTGVQIVVRTAFPSDELNPITVKFSRPMLRTVPDPRTAWA